MDIMELLRTYGRIYNHLYDNYDQEYINIMERDYSDLFGDAMEEEPAFKDIVIRAAKVREDAFISDRERAAIVLAYKAMNQRQMLKEIAIENGSL